MNQAKPPARGMGQKGAPYQALLQDEVNPVPDALREAPEVPEAVAAPYRVSVDRYLDRAYHTREVARMWNRTWQATCRETEIAAPGSCHVYDIATYSILIVRTESGAIKAYHNACLHRGRKLKTAGGHARELRCPYHGFRWDLDGRFVGAPCAWDFPHVEPGEFGLPEVRVATWGGWVFINMDPGAKPLADYLGILPDHFTRWEPENRYKAIHVEKVLGCNWKVAMEAFVESHHVVATHPQIMTYFGDAVSQYDVYSDTVSRTITPLGISSPHIEAADPGKIVNEWLTQTGRLPRGQKIDVPENVSAREFLANMFFAQYGYMYKRDIGAVATRSEVLDAIFYSVFPNFAPWAGFGPNLVYRFKPLGDDHLKCTMEIMMMVICPAGEDRPKDCQMHRLSEDQTFSEAEELLGLGRIIDQDLANLRHVQDGMASLRDGELVLSDYQEIRIRAFHQTLDRYVYG